MDQTIEEHKSKSLEELKKLIKETEEQILILEDDGDHDGVAENKTLLEALKTLLENRAKGGEEPSQKKSRKKRSELKEEIEESKNKIQEYTEKKRTKKANEEKAKLARLEYQIQIVNTIKEAKENITQYEEKKRVKRASDEKAKLERLEKQLDILNEIEEEVTNIIEHEKKKNEGEAATAQAKVEILEKELLILEAKNKILEFEKNKDDENAEKEKSKLEKLEKEFAKMKGLGKKQRKTEPELESEEMKADSKKERKEDLKSELERLQREIDKAFENEKLVDEEITDKKRVIEEIQAIEAKKTKTKKAVELLEFLKGLLEKILRMEFLQAKMEEGAIVAKKMDKISKEPICKEFYNISVNFLQEMAKHNISSIIQFKKRKEFDKKNEDCFITLGDSLKSLENLMKMILNSISLDINELEDQFKIFNEQISLSSENKEAILYLEQIIKFNKFIELDERLQNLESDIWIYPNNSIEKRIMEMIYQLKLTLLSEPAIIHQKTEEIKTQLALESLETYTIKEILQSIQKNSNEKEKIPALIANLEDLFKKLNPINIQEIDRLFRKTDTSAKKIKDKKILLFLGGTGAGKSTTICYLAGCKMKKIAAGHIEIDPASQTKIQCKISSATKSETRYINPISLPLKNLIKYCNEEEMILCDAPGFLDTEGPEIDMANGLGIIKAVKGCQAVKPVIFFSKMNVGARWEHVQSLLSTLIGIISNLGYQVKNIDFLFTHFAEEERNIIIQKFTELRDSKANSKNGQDQLIYTILDDIVKRADILKIVDPLDSHPDVILKDWLGNENYITSCSEIFKFDITIESKSKVVEHCSLMKSSILNHVKKLKNYGIADFKLKQLKLLLEIVGIVEIKQSIEECVNEICLFLNNYYTETCETFNKCLIEGNLLRKEDLDKYNESIELMKQTTELKNNHLGDKLKGVDYFESNLERAVDKFLLIIKEKNCKDSKMFEAIGKIFSISRYFSNNEVIQEKTKLIRNEMEQKINQSFEKFNQGLENIKSDPDGSKIRENLELIVNVLNYTETLSENLEKYFEGISAKEKKFREELNSFFKNLSETPMTEAMLDEPKTVIETKLKTLKIFEVAQNFMTLGKVISLSQLKEYQDNILLNIQSNCRQIFVDIQNDFTEKSQDIALLEQRFSLLSLYKDKLKDPRYKCYIEDTVKEANDFLKVTMQQIQTDVNKAINDLTEKNVKLDTRNVLKFSRGLIYLYKADWIKKYIPNFVLSVHAGLQTTVSDYLSLQKEEFVNRDLRLFNYDKLQDAVMFLDDILKFKDTKILGEDVITLFKEIEQHFEQAVDKVLAMKVDVTRDLETANDIFNYLGQFKDVFKIQIVLRKMKMNKYIEESEKRLGELKVELFNDFEDMEKKLKECFLNLKKDEITQKEINEYCSFVTDCLPKFKKISNLNQISKFQTRPYELWVKDYEKFYHEFVDTLSYCNDNSKLLLKLNICNRLSKLDEENKKETSFLELYQTYKERMINEKQSEMEYAVNNLIPNHEFEKLKTDVLAGLKSEDLNNPAIVKIFNEKNNKIKQALTAEISKIREKIDDQINELIAKFQVDTIKKIKEILRQMKKFESANKNVKDFITIKDENETFEYYVNTCKDTFKYVVTNLQKLIIYGYQQKKFFESEQKIVETFDLLKFDKFYDVKELNKIKEGFAKERAESLKKLLNELDGVTFDEWTYDSTIDYYPILEECSKNLNFPIDVQTEYSEVSKKFFITLREKIYDKLKSIQSSVYNYEYEMKSMTAIKKKFPPQLQSFFDAKKANAEEEKKLAQLISDRTNKIEEFSKQGDFPKLINLYNESRTIPTIPAKIEEAVTQNISQVIKSMTDSIEYQKCDDLVSQNKIIENFKTSCEKLTNESLKNKLFQTIQKDIQTSYKDHFRKPLENLPTIFNYEISDNKNVDTDSFMQIAKFLTKVLQKLRQLTCFPSLESDISQNYEKIQKILDRDQQIFNEYTRTFKQRDAKLVKTLIKHREKCEDLLKQLTTEDAIEAFKKSEAAPLKAFVIFVPNVKITTQDFMETLVVKLKEKEEVFNSLDFVEKEKKDSLSRARDYDQIQNELAILEDFKLFGEFNSVFFKAQEKAVDTIQTKLETHYEEIENYYLRPKQKNYSEDDCIKLNKKIENIKMVSNKFPIFQKACCENVNNITTNLTQKLLEKKESALKSTDVNSIVDALIQLQAVNYVEEIKKPEWVDEILLNYKKNAENNKLNGTQELNKIGVLLQSHPTGKTLVSENKMFKGLNLSLFNQKLQKYGIDEVLKNIDGDDLDKDLLKKRYEDVFKPTYESLVEKYLKPKPVGINLQALKNELRLVLEKISNKGMIATFKSWFKDSKKLELPNILAHLFAIWTLMNAEDFFENSDQVTTESKGKYLFQPHAAQVVSIFRMMSCGDSNEAIRNNLVQIGTGEGKSVTLAMTSSTLALLGYSIDCACYSPYLSARDYDDFKKFFSFLDVLDYIEYGSFNALCEKNINSEVNIRDSVLEYCGAKLDEKLALSKKGNDKREKVLLIDEVDVFFSKDFYGALYNPSAVLKDQTISDLFRYIWKGRETMSFAKAVKSPEFTACVKKFQNAEKLLKEALKDIVAAVKEDIPQNYEVLQDQIGYKEQDSISFNVSYGYTTVFTYFFEYDKKNITDKSLEDHLGILIRTGSFSFAEIPKISYSFIMGVTGTLRTLGEVQKKILKESYNITRSTYMPSVFGKNNRKFNKRDDLHIEDEVDFYEKIRKEIERTMEKRAVLVFFEDEAKLNTFYNSDNFKLLKDKANILTERATAKEKNDFVSVATLANKISLMPRCFGRGTDFKCRDDFVIKAGGVHVIQTFLSLDLSEEVQIQGRCARQGDDGSYSMVLLKSDLEAFLITEIPENDKYDFLDKKRTKYFNDDNLKNEHLINESNAEHRKSMEFLAALLTKDKAFISKYLLELNRGIEMETKVLSRTICLMDATGSMGNLLECGKKTITQVFKRAKEILLDEGADPDCFEFQIAFYRNYSSGMEKLLEASNWVKKPDDLQTFMSKNQTSGGQGNEAIEVGLWHSNREHDLKPITQIMIIGDAAPNSQNDVFSKREGYTSGYIAGYFTGNKGENYWRNTPYHTPTFFKKELDELKGKKVKVHPFYVWDSNSLKASFQELANNAKGCQFLDVNNAAKGADDLLDTLAKVILNDIGGEKFEAKYEKKYRAGKVHT